MKKDGKNENVAKGLVIAAKMVLSAAANHRCVLIYHQPKQPESVKKFKKF